MKARLFFYTCLFGATALHAASPALDLPATLDPKRKELIDKALAALEAHPGIPYRFAGSAPEEGGMDCSGAVFYLLGLAGIDPPRTAQAQYAWVKEAGNLTIVPAEATAPDHASFAKLQPGDLIFWGHEKEGADPAVTHVQIYLGKESKDGLRVMIGASDGRSYRGVKKNGFDIVDFRVPKADAGKRLLGYGPPSWPVKKSDKHK